jgi:methyl-accepting chemotaxis protein
MTNKKSERRSKILIHPQFQKKQILTFSFLFLTSMIFLGAVVYLRALTTVYDETANAIKFVLPVFIISGGLLIILIALVALIQSHKIAGANYHIETDLDKLSTGDLKVKFNIRKDDEFHSLVAALNKLVSFLYAQILDTKKAYATFKLSLEEWEKKEKIAIPAEIKTKLKGIEEKIEKFKT